MLKNILSLDLGRKTLGISISRSGKLVTPLENYRFKEDDYKSALNRVAFYMQKEIVENIVIGVAYYKSGDISPMGEQSLEFKRMIEEMIKDNIDNKTNRFFYNGQVKIFTLNEAHSTQEALDILHSNNIDNKKGKKNIDCIASYVILERFIENNK